MPKEIIDNTNSPDLQEQSAAVIPLRSRVTVDAAQVINHFWETHEVALKEKISRMPHFDAMFKGFKKEHQDMDEEEFRAVIFEHERVFVNHILTRLTQILNNAQEQHLLDEGGVIFNIQTTMLYDIDETLFHKFFYVAPSIRPVARILFEFIRDELPVIHLGLLSARKEDLMRKQFRDEGARYSLAEVAEFFDDDGVIGIANIGGGMMPEHKNSKNFDPSFYPEWRPEDNVAHLLVTEMGFDEAEAAAFIEEELPQFLAHLERFELLQQTNLYFSSELESGLESAFDEAGLNSYGDECKNLKEILTAEIQLCTEVLIDIYDSADSAEDKATKLQKVIDDISEIARSHGNEYVDIVKPAVSIAVGKINEYFDGLEEDYWYGKVENKPSNGKRRDMLLALIRDEREGAFKGNIPKYLEDVVYDGRSSNSAYSLVRRRALYSEEGPRYMHPNFQVGLSKAVNKIADANKAHQEKFDEKLAELFQIEGGYRLEHVRRALQRLAACKRQLDSGASSVSIAVDNAQIAEQLDQMFQGNFVGPDGVAVDAHELFNLPEDYRGRINLIHVNAEYSREAINLRIIEALAA